MGGYTYYLKSCKLQTGWQKISGKYYYLGTDGKMAVNTTVDGVEIGADGVAVSAPTAAKTRILLIAGHGQGDVGAIGNYGRVYWNHIRSSAKFVQINPRHTQFDSCSILNIRKKSDEVFAELE